jgi:hypothetical protein
MVVMPSIYSPSLLPLLPAEAQVSDHPGAADLYKSLKRDPAGWQEIRLFLLFPGTHGSAIRGRLFPMRMENYLVDESQQVNSDTTCMSEYEALSYVWGGRGDSCWIFLNEVPFQVTPNLYAALAQLRLVDCERVLWIDAICINQDDDDEKGHQVSLMRDIYGTASQVLIWLGDTDLHGSGGLKKLRDLFNTKPPHATARFLFSEGFSEGLRNILTRRWWGRVWVVQEAAVARKLAFLCGPDRLDLPHRHDDLAELAEALQDALSSGESKLATNSVCLEHLLGVVQTQQNRVGGAKSKLPDLIHTHLRRQCYDPRDRVFAFLGLSETYDATRNPPDYAMTIEEVTVRLLCHSVRNIDPNSSGPTQRTGTGTNETSQLERICKTLVAQNRKNRIFRASGNSNVDIRWHYVQDMPVRPALSGIIVDAVSDNNAAIQETLLLDPGGSVLFRTKSASELSRRVEWDPVTRVESYRDTNSTQSFDYRPFKDFNLFYKGRLAGPVTTLNKRPERWTYTFTSEKRQALVPRKAKPGDMVCIFLGFPLPFILRQREDRTFSILGECYVHGVMYSEIVQFDEVHSAFLGDCWSWDDGPLRRKRRNAFSFSNDSLPSHPFLNHVRVAQGLEIQDIILTDWIPPPSPKELEFKPTLTSPT